jgi:hypothetical protein
MTKRIEKFRKNALEETVKREELKEQQDINRGDLAIIDDLLRTPLADEASAVQIESLSKAVSEEQGLLDRNISENEDEIAKTLGEIDDCTEGLESDIRKYERMEKITDLVNVKPHIEDSKSKIDELDEIRRMLDDDAPQRTYGSLDGNLGFVPLSEKSNEFQEHSNSIESEIDSRTDIASHNAFISSLIFQKVSEQQGMSIDYKNTVINRLNCGNTIAKSVYLRFVPSGAVDDGNFGKTPHYSTKNGKIKMNYDKDLFNPQGGGVTYLHENGHLIDFSQKNPISDDSLFERALNDDFETYMVNYMKDNNILDRKEAALFVSKELRGSRLSSVSDLFGAMGLPPSPGRWGHDRSYWQSDPKNLNQEAFAHFFEAQFDNERLEAMRKYFPCASKEFDRLLGGL